MFPSRSPLLSVHPLCSPSQGAPCDGPLALLPSSLFEFPCPSPPPVSHSVPLLTFKSHTSRHFASNISCVICDLQVECSPACWTCSLLSLFPSFCWVSPRVSQPETERRPAAFTSPVATRISAPPQPHPSAHADPQAQPTLEYEQGSTTRADTTTNTSNRGSDKREERRRFGFDSPLQLASRHERIR